MSILASIKITFRLMGPGGHGKFNTTVLEIKRIRVQLPPFRMFFLFAAWRPVID